MTLLNSENTYKLLDDMSDGQWHTFTKITQRNQRNFATTEELRGVVNKLADRETFISGSNDSFRMTRNALESWREERNLSMSNAKDMKAPRFFGGILEDDGWEKAPLRSIDVVHFHATGDAIQQVQKVIGLHGMTSYDFDGLVRVFSLDGTKAYEILKEWSKEEGVDISGIRIDHNVKRRELCDLPSQYLSDMCKFYGNFSHALLRRSMSSVRKHIIEQDDIQQQIYLWVMDAIQRYDAETSIPFAAYLSTSLNRWVHDLNRKSFGRAVADNELRIARAVNAFQEDHKRKPTLEEIAHELDESVDKVRKKMFGVSNVNGLRGATTINSEEFDIPIIAHEDSTSRLHADIEQTLLSAALTSSTLENDKTPNVLAWCNIYAKTWQKNSNKKVAGEQEIMDKMKLRLSEMR
jgi:DNA-directed RNA polymerase specialized sigma subunit